jgi:hypothetical protein
MGGSVITINPLFRTKELDQRIKGFNVSIGRLEHDIHDIHEIIESGMNKNENRVPRHEQLNKMQRNLKIYTNARDRNLKELNRLLQIQSGSRRLRRVSRRSNKTRKMRKS